MASTEAEPVLCVIGLMSGTSMDGVDAALLYTDGVTIQRTDKALTIPYSADIREALKAAILEASSGTLKTEPSAAIIETERLITDLHTDAVNQLLAGADIAASDVDVIGFHGQTIAHRPDLGWTWQIGDAKRLAKQTKIPVVSDFRSQDMDNGGQGAPLVPVYHAALLGRDRRHDVIAVLNIGGVANISWISFEGDETNPEIIAFDTGPGNALIDDWVEIHTGDSFDKDGLHAARGSVHEEIMLSLMASPYFDETPPKALDRGDFNGQAARGLSFEDGAATLTEFMVQSIVASQEHLPKPPEAWYVCGGGRLNKTFMRNLRRRLPVIVDPVEVIGWQGDAVEAQAFGYLAARSLKNLPLTFPTTTGVSSPQTGGTRVSR